MGLIKNFNQLDLSKQYNYADYLTWKFDERVELIKGWVHKMSPAPNLNHQTISTNLGGQLFNYFEESNCRLFYAPFDVRLFKNNKQNSKVQTVVQPDICVVCNNEKLDTKGCLGPPDLVVEIASPGNSKKELKLKFELYEENEVKEYWVVIPDEECLHQYVLINNRYSLIKSFFSDDVFTSVLFSDLKISLKKVFKF